MENKKMIPCPACYGQGKWETECCNGAGGCSCRGGMVDMGQCKVCRGSGEVEEGNFNNMANVDYLRASGACFLGSGPSDGYWASARALNMPSK